jgi:hypothetical protein
MSSAREKLLSAVDAEWPKAIQDAGLARNALLLCPTDHSPTTLSGSPAQWFPPFLEARGLEGFPPEHYEEADSESKWERHRIVVRLSYDYPPTLGSDATQALVGAGLRHELEHARQYQDCPAFYEFTYQVVLPVLWHAFNGSYPNDIINRMPIEIDANAAASRYLKTQHPAHIEALRATIWADLVQMNTGPQPTATLLSRMVAFLYLFRESAERWTQPLLVRDCIAGISVEAAVIWEQLTGHDSIYGRLPESRLIARTF